MTTAILLHAHPSVRERYAEALGCSVTIVNSTGSQFSAGYDGTTGIAAKPLTSFLAEHAPGWQSQHLVLLGFSAGCWAIRHWLRDATNRMLIQAVVLIDGLHGESEASLGAVLEYGRICRASPSRRQLVITNSDIDPVTYPSTTEAARWLLDRLVGMRDRQDHWIGDGVAVLDHGGRDAAAHRAELQEHGVEVCRRYVRPLLLALEGEADTQPSRPASDLPLRERALAVCLAEARHWGSQRPPDQVIQAYFAGAERGGRVLGLRTGNHCAGAQGWAERRAALPGEVLPPWRAAAKEIMADARAGRRGRWHPQAEVLAGYRPPPGALAIYHRGAPGAWTGHVDRVCRVIDSELYECVGANEAAGAWRVEATNVAHPRLLGFAVDGEEPVTTAIGSDVVPPEAVEPEWSLAERAAFRGLIGLTLADAARAAVEQSRRERGT